MGKLRVLLFAMLLAWHASSVAAKRRKEKDSRSAVSYVFCDGFNPSAVNFDVSIRPKDKRSSPPRFTVKFSGNTQKMFLDGTIDQLSGVKDVQIESDVMEEICFDSLVVDTTIIIDRTTRLKKVCPSEMVRDECQNFGSDLKPAFICPAALTRLLKKKKVIRRKSVVNDPQIKGMPPVYDITDDMAQASYEIANGVVEGSRLALKHFTNANPANIVNAASRFNSFAKALGPVFSVFSAITSIVTTFLTPNPFDMLAEYLEKKFDYVNKQLQDIQLDIKRLERLLVSGSNTLALAPAMRSIRHTMRSYKSMLEALPKNHPCDGESLLALHEVRKFMDDYQENKLKNNLQDLLTADSGGVPEASGGLLKPFMLANCVKNPQKISDFMQHMVSYATGAMFSLFTHESLLCLKLKRKRCHKLGRKKRRNWLKLMHNFTTQANMYRDALTKPHKALERHMQKDFRTIINKAVPKNGSPKIPDKDLFKKIQESVNQTLQDKTDWPYHCFTSPRIKKNVLILGFAQIDGRVFGRAFKPWALFDSVKRQQDNYTYILPTDKGAYVKKHFSTEDNRHDNSQLLAQNRDKYFFDCQFSGNQVCMFRAWKLKEVPPEEPSEDNILYFLYNPVNYEKKNKGSTRKVVVNMLPIDVYFYPKKNVKRSGRYLRPLKDGLTVGCWDMSTKGAEWRHRWWSWKREYICKAPSTDPKHRNKISEKGRDVAMIYD